MTKIITLAPARTCLFGDHQDYIGLPIIACAIDRHIKLVATPNKNSTLNLKMLDIDEEYTIKITDDFKDVKGNFFKAVLKVLKQYKCIPTVGYDVVIKGNIVINAGISSSSALIIAWVKFLLEAYGCNQEITPVFVSQIAYQAEVIEQDSSGGKMDQYSIGLGGIIYLETGSDFMYEKFDIAIPGLIIGESGIPKDTLGVLKELKENAWLSILKIREKIKDFDIKHVKSEDLPNLLNYLPETLKPYFFAAVSNFLITQKALKEFKKKRSTLKK